MQNSALTFKIGLKDGLPIALGYLSVAFAFGMLTVEHGLAGWAAPAISLSNFTGTGQFVGMELIASHVSLWELAFTMFVVNIRYLLMSLTLSQRLDSQVSFSQRLLIAFGNTDEIFAVAMQKQQTLPFSYMLGLILCSYFGWNVGTILGVVASGILPLSVQAALGIALYAMFIAIIIPPANDSKPVLRIVIVSAVLSCIFKWFPFFASIGDGWIVIICGIVAAGLGAYFYPVQNNVAQAEDGES